MKLEKREISLNESDSINDALNAQRILLIEYAQALHKIGCKQTRNTVKENICEIVEDIFTLSDLKSTSEQ